MALALALAMAMAMALALAMALAMARKQTPEKNRGINQSSCRWEMPMERTGALIDGVRSGWDSELK